jgi:hypothetical protein
MKKKYGNDATILPQQHRLSKRTWSILCNGAIGAGSISVALLGAVPTAGATIGMAICGYVISCALC